MPRYRSRTTTEGRNMAGARALWRATGALRLAASLIETATEGDEDSATVAAMMLVKGGHKAIAPVSVAIADGNIELVGILVSIGSTAARDALVKLSSSPDAAVAAAAASGVERLDRLRQQ